VRTRSLRPRRHAGRALAASWRSLCCPFSYRSFLSKRHRACRDQGLAYWLNRRLGVEWCVAGPSAGNPRGSVTYLNKPRANRSWRAAFRPDGFAGRRATPCRENAPHAAKNLLKALRAVAKVAIKLAVIAKDPTTGAKVYAPSSEAGFKVWEESDIAQFRNLKRAGRSAPANGSPLLCSFIRDDELSRAHCRHSFRHDP
jgi:hypothetical protein